MCAAVWLLADLNFKEFCKYVRIVPRTIGMLAKSAFLKRGKAWVLFLAGGFGFCDKS